MHNVKEDIRSYAIRCGACACGFAKADKVDEVSITNYQEWIASGGNASMDYCTKYTAQRNDPRLLLDDARTVISCAFNYYTNESTPPLSHHISRYAWGKDYHWVVKNRLQQLAQYIKSTYGGECRPCVDSAPIRERYWAVKSGIGFIGNNGTLIVPGYGSYVFLGELLWTGTVAPDSPCTLTCGECGACTKACPNGAINPDGTCNANKCISYLTIEHRTDLPDDVKLCGSFYGCDICQSVCPHNRHLPATSIDDFSPNTDILSLSEEDFGSMTSSHFRKLTSQSAMSRIPLEQLLRNIRHGATEKGDPEQIQEKIV